MSVDKELLLKSRLPEAEIEIPDVGTVRVRALSRADVMALQRVKDGPGREEALERKMIALALVDPVLSEAEVGQWQKTSSALEMTPVTERICELSGMDADAAKRAYKEFESDPDAEFRVLPGGEAEDDGSPAAG